MIKQSSNKKATLSHLMQHAESIKCQVIQTNGEIAWDIRLDLQKTFENIILTDVDFALTKHIEQNLWNMCYKNCIDCLQKQINNRKSTDDAAMLSVFFMSIIGHFHLFLMKLGNTYKIDIPGLNSCASNLCNAYYEVETKLNVVNVKHVVQFCLVHLGDIARYQKNVNQAESYYLHAVNICPQNGHSFNQLAIIQTARGNKLGSAYFYYRSLHCQAPFIMAGTNVEKFFSSMPPSTKEMQISTVNYITAFLQFHACILQYSNLAVATELQSLLSAKLLNCLKCNSVKPYQLQLMFIVTISTLYKIFAEAVFANIDQLLNGLTEDEKLTFNLLSSLLLNQASISLDYFANLEDTTKGFEVLIVFKVLFDWIKCYDIMLQFADINSEKHMFNFFASVCLYLNKLDQSDNFKKVKGFKDTTPLPCDFELQGYLPLERVHSKLDFNQCLPSINLDNKIYERLITGRLISFGKWMAGIVNNDKFCYKSDETGMTVFASSQTTTGLQQTTANSIKTQDGDNEKATILQSPLMIKKTSKLVAIKSLMDSENEMTGNKLKMSVKEQPKFKIAAPGTKVELPLASEKSEDTEAKSTDNSKELSESNRNRSKYELPPRFQAARLKLALGGHNATSIKPFCIAQSEGPSSFSGRNRSAFPPLSMNLTGQTNITSAGAKSLLENFTESTSYESSLMKESVPASLSPGGEELSDSTTASCKTLFPKTPGVRPSNSLDLRFNVPYLNNAGLPLPIPFQPFGNFIAPTSKQDNNVEGKTRSQWTSNDAPQNSVLIPRPDDPIFRMWSQQHLGQEANIQSSNEWHSQNDFSGNMHQNLQFPLFSFTQNVNRPLVTTSSMNFATTNAGRSSNYMQSQPLFPVAAFGIFPENLAQTSIHSAGVIPPNSSENSHQDSSGASLNTVVSNPWGNNYTAWSNNDGNKK